MKSPLFAVLLTVALSGCVSETAWRSWIDSSTGSGNIHPSSPWYSGPPPRSHSEPRGPIRENRRLAPPAGDLVSERPVTVPFDGTVTESYSGTRTFRDRRSGAIVGSESKSPSGTTTYRDGSGRLVGSSDESYSGTTTYRDGDGRISGTSSSSVDGGGGRTTTYRRNGVIVGTQYVSPAGNVTWRDGRGSIIDGPGGMKP